MYDRVVRGLLILISVLLLQLSLVACNTMEGVGQDLEAAGEKIEQKAKEKKRY